MEEPKRYLTEEELKNGMIIINPSELDRQINGKMILDDSGHWRWATLKKKEGDFNNAFEELMSFIA